MEAEETATYRTHRILFLAGRIADMVQWSHAAHT